MSQRADAVVVGAGLAGLIAARTLRDAGLNTVLLEARDRVGGRTRTDWFDAAGCAVDLGAEWVSPAVHRALVTESNRYGLRLAQAEETTEVWAEAGQRARVLTREEETRFDDALDTLNQDARLIDFDRPDWFENVEAFDIPMADYLSRLSLGETVREYFLAHAFALMGADHHEYSAINLLHEIAGFGSAAAAFGGESSRIAGGADSVARAIAADLGDIVQLRWPVSEISVRDGQIEIVGASGSHVAAAAVIALPTNVLSEVRLDVPITAEARRVIREGHAGSVAKGWASATGFDPSTTSLGWPHAIETYGVRAPNSLALATFGLANNETHAGTLEHSWAEVSNRHPEAVVGDSFLSHDWLADPFARGTWHGALPGQARGWYELANTAGPCFFAGGDLSRRWIGWMDGAITSGADAATRLLAMRTGHTVLPAGG